MPSTSINRLVFIIILELVANVNCLQTDDQSATSHSQAAPPRSNLAGAVLSPLSILIKQQHQQANVASSRNNQPKQQSPEATNINPLQIASNSTSQPTNKPNELMYHKQLQRLHRLQANSTANANQLAHVRARWRLMEQSLGNSMDLIAQQFRKTIDDLLKQVLEQHQRANANVISSKCQLGLNLLLDALGEQELWASRMIDSSARLPVGLLEGTLTELGNFDECLGITKTIHSQQSIGLNNNHNNQQQLAGQYCSLLIKPHLIARPRLHTACNKLPSLSQTLAGATSNWSNQTLRLMSQNSHQFHYAGLRLGVCVPNWCQPADVQQLLTMYLTKFELIGQVKSCQQLNEQSQQQQQQLQANRHLLLSAIVPEKIGAKQLDLIQQCILLCFATLLLLVALGTMLDGNNRHQDTKRINYNHNQTTSSVFVAPNALKACKLLPISLDKSRDDELYKPLAGNKSSARGQIKDRPNKQAPAAQQYQLYCSSSSESSQGNGNGNSGFRHLASPMAETDANHRASFFSLSFSQPCIEQQQNPLAKFKVDATEAVAETHDDQIMGPVRCGKISSQTHAGKPEARTTTSENINITPKNSGIGNATKSPAKKSSDSDFKRSLISFMICFSLKRSLRSVAKFTSDNKSTDLRQDNDMNDIKVIHGLRTFTMIWIIFGHTIGLVTPEMMNNLFPLANLSCSSRFLQAILNATLAVNTFFMISGLVTAISFARKCKSAYCLVNPKQRNVSEPAADGKTHVDGGRISSSKLEPWPGANIDRNYFPSAASTDFNNDNLQKCSKNIRQKHPRTSSATTNTSTSSTNGLEFEVSSIDSTSSVVTSLSSSASSNRCIRSSSANDGRKSNTKSSGNDYRAPTSLGCWPKDFQPSLWVLMRYMRLTPTYATIIGFSILLPALGSGPFWSESVEPLGQSCRNNWMFNLLYVNNFIETDNLCLIHSWYLSNDWQFFLMALVLFAIYYKSKKATLVLAITICMASSAATFLITVENDFPPTIVTTSPAVAERWLFIHSLYYKPWPHVSSYIIGLFVGYLIVIRHSLTSTLNSGWRLICWLLFSAIALALLNSIYPWNMGLHVDPIITGLHSATFRTLWACCCGWLIFGLISRPDNLLAKFLSWRGFQLSSRLTYCAYLVHPLIIYYHFGVIRERIDSTMYGQFHRFVATLGLSYLFAFFVALLIESPSIQVQKLLANLSRRNSNGNDNLNYQSNQDFQSKNNSDHLLQHQQQQQSDCPDKEAPKASSRKRLSESSQTDMSWSTILTSAADHSFPENVSSTKLNNIKVGDVNNNHLSESMNHRKSISDLTNHQNDQSTKLTRASRSQLHLFNVPQQSIDDSCCFHFDNGNGGDHSPGSDRSHQTSYTSSSAIDEDFQRKLAQAIGRGFKIRSRIANGTIRHQQRPSNNDNMPSVAVRYDCHNHDALLPVISKRFGAAKKLPSARAGLATDIFEFQDVHQSLDPVTSTNGENTKKANYDKSKTSNSKDPSIINDNRNRSKRRNSCSTFVPNQSGERESEASNNPSN